MPGFRCVCVQRATFKVPQLGEMWMKFAAVAAIVFHRADALFVAHVALQRERHSAVDYWLGRGPALRGTPRSDWKTLPGQNGAALLGGAFAPTDPTPGSKCNKLQGAFGGSMPPSGDIQDFVPAKHMAEGLKPDHPANRNYK